MSPTIVRILKFALVLAVPYLLVIGAVRLLVTDGYLSIAYARAGFPPDPFGFTTAERLDYASANFRYVREALPLAALADARRDGALRYNARELKHMQDVQAVFQAVWAGWLVVLGLSLAGVVTLGRRRETRLRLLEAIRSGGLLTAGLITVVGALAVLAWRAWFVAFHQVFFAAGSWTFAISDTLIRLFPERFWFDAALTIAGLSSIGGATLGVAAWVALTSERLSILPEPAPAGATLRRMRSPLSQFTSAIRFTRTGQPRWRLAAYLMTVVGVLSLTGSLFYAAVARPALAPLSGNVIEIAADMSGFDMQLIRVQAGQPVTIRLTSLDNSNHTDGGGQHQWAVEELGLSVVAPPKGSNTITFTPDKPGTYTYFCDICCGGRANPAMQGTLVVEG